VLLTNNNFVNNLFKIDTYLQLLLLQPPLTPPSFSITIIFSFYRASACNARRVRYCQGKSVRPMPVLWIDISTHFLTVWYGQTTVPSAGTKLQGKPLS